MKIHKLAFLLLLPSLFACNQSLEAQSDSVQNLDRNESEAPKTIFKSTDGGQTWQDISEGLPENLQRDGFFANESGLYLRAGNGIYHSKSNSTAPFWKKMIFPDTDSSMTPGNTGIYAFNFDGQYLQNINGTAEWAPRYANFPQKEIRTVFETAAGSVFVGCNNGLFKSTDNGKNWKEVYTGGWIMKLVESNGVLVATSQRGIIRSTDNGENWENVISEGGVGIEIQCINGGFAAITYNTELETRRVRTSRDGGKTWQPIDAGLPPSPLIASIIKVGNYFFCGHPSGVFRSSDNGKTWQLILPSKGHKGFNLSVSGNTIYAIPGIRGC